MSDLSNQVIGPYQIEKLLGQGGMGSVYRARDIQLQRLVAFKMMHPEIAAHEDLRKRFLQEARAIAALDHPNIIRIYSFHGDAKDLYLVMEYVPGGSLRDYLRQLQRDESHIEIPEAVALIKQLGSALHFAHKENMVHRDVKPDNVLLTLATSPGVGGMRFNAVLTDFGLAKLADNAIVQTAGHNPMGTLPYMPPEQIRGENMDGRTDLYALGILMYELIVGQLPFVPRNIPEALKMHSSDEPPKPSSIRAGLAPELEKIILKAIAKHPDDRYQTGNELVEAIERMEAEAQTAADYDPNEHLATYIDPRMLDSKKEASLGTYLASMPGVPDVGDIEVPDAPTGLQRDQVVIMRKGFSARYVAIVKQSLTIGRDPSGDIEIQGEKVSRNHARIDRKADGTYTITDLGSTNGTYMDEAKLLSNVPEAWLADRIVSIGDFRLSIQKAVTYETQRNVEAVQSDIAGGIPGLAPPPDPKQTQQTPYTTGGPRQQLVEVQINPSLVTVDPGSQASVSVEIYNQSDIVEHYRIQVQGIPVEWFTVPPNRLQLLPGSRGSLPIAFHPPRNPKSTAGTHTFSVRVSSEERGAEIGRGTGLITIKPFYQYSVDMEPKRIRKRGMVRFILHNQSNAPDSYTIYGRDREEGLNFYPPSHSGTVGGGLTQVYEFEARPKRGNLIGSVKTYPFELQADAASGRQQNQPGELVHPATIPLWLLSLLMLLCLACLALLFLLYSNQPKDEVDNGNIITQTNADVRELLTATAVQFATREVVRNEPATAVALLEDDRDGLTNAEEAELGTLPDNDDSDNDGLTDGDEVNEYKTDPLNDDSDNDGLKDGEEIDEYDTDPNDDDSDNDDLTDGDEVFKYNTKPDKDDSDRDGLTDGIEVNERNTDPNEWDTDKDGVNDSLDQFPNDSSKTTSNNTP